MYDAEYDTQRQTRLSCVVLNTTERQTPMEACEEIMRGMPTCGKYEWRHNRDKRERKKNSRWVLVAGVGFCPVGSCSDGGLLPPYSANYIQMKQLTHFLSGQEPDVSLFWLLFFLAHFFSDIFQGVHDAVYNISSVELDPFTHHF